jgi:hypothetical protein
VIVNVLCALVGFTLIAVALFLIYPPLALIWCGLVLLALGFFREVPDAASE